MTIKIDIDRMQEALDSEVVEVGVGLTREEKRELIVNSSKEINSKETDSKETDSKETDSKEPTPKKTKRSNSSRCPFTIDLVEMLTGEPYEKPKGGKSY